MNIESSGHNTESSQGRPDPKLQDRVDTLTHRVKFTYYSRLQTAKRLQTRTLTWNMFLVVSALVTTIISVVLLVDPSAYGNQGGAAIVILGIATLVASLLVTTANYSARSEIFFRGYRDLQRLWVKLDTQNISEDKTFRKFENRYQQLLDDLPNHSESDFITAKKYLNKRETTYTSSSDTRTSQKYSTFVDSIKVYSSVSFTYLPVFLSLLLIILLIPTIIWLFK